MEDFVLEIIDFYNAHCGYILPAVLGLVLFGLALQVVRLFTGFFKEIKK